MQVTATLLGGRRAGGAFDARSILLAGALLFAGAGAQGASPGDPVVLTKGHPVWRSLSGGQRHAYLFEASEDDMFRVRVDNQRIALVLTVTSPGGSTLLRLDEPVASGRKDLVVIAPEAGVHGIHVTPRYEAAEPGDYEISVPERRPAFARDREVALAISVEARIEQLGNADRAEDILSAVVAAEDAVKRWRRLGVDPALARTLASLGETLWIAGRASESREALAEAAEVARRSGTRSAEATVATNQGVSGVIGGDSAAGLDLLREGVRLAEASGEVRVLISAESNLALGYDLVRDHQASLDHQHRALQLARNARETDLEAYVLGRLGRVYANVGHNGRALEYLEAAVVKARATGQRRAVASLVGQIGAAYAQMERWDEAMPYLEESLHLSRLLRQLALELSVLYLIGRARLVSGDAEGAVEVLVPACERAREAGLRHPDGIRVLADAEAARGRLADASALYEESLEMARGLQEPFFEALALRGLSTVAVRRSRLAEAAAHAQSALRLLEAARARVAEERARAAFLGHVRGAYDHAVRVAMLRHAERPHGGHDREALELAERAHARVLLDGLAPLPRLRTEHALTTRVRELERAVSAQTRKKSEAATEGERSEADAELRRLLSEAEVVRAEIPRQRRAEAGAALPEPLGFEGIQQLLDADTLLLEYQLGPDGSYVFAVTHDGLVAAELPAKGTIEDRARRFHTLLTERKERVPFETDEERLRRWAQADDESEGVARELSRILLAPVASVLGRHRRLVVVADGALHYVPFAVLPDPLRQGAAGGGRSLARAAFGFEPLIDRYDVVHLSSASVLAALRVQAAGRPVPAKTLVVLADPVFDADDPRVARNHPAAGGLGAIPVVPGAAGSSLRALEDGELFAAIDRSSGGMGLARLPFTRREAESIASLVPRAGARVAMGFEASRDTALGPALADYRIVHFATHGHVDGSDPRLSGLVLSRVDPQGAPIDGVLRPSDIAGMTLNAELVTLSACETALGEEVRGEGLVGLTQAFLDAGTQRVLATLWRVDDDATAALMELVYRGILKEGRSPAAALGQAQRAMRAHPRWRSPFYWAGVSLLGEPL